MPQIETVPHVSPFSVHCCVVLHSVEADGEGATGEFDTEATEVGDATLEFEGARDRDFDGPEEADAWEELEIEDVMEAADVLEGASDREIEPVAVLVDEARFEMEGLVDAVCPTIFEGAGVLVFV
jgi:hypothetical protein